MDDQFLHIQTEEIQRDGKDSFHFHRYEPTPYDVLDNLFEFLPLKEDDIFVDYGSGLGRVDFYVTYRFHCKSVGIEMNEEYFSRCLENAETFIGDKNKLSFCLTKAEEYQIGNNENIFYFFNPFSMVIFRKVINQILASLVIAPRKLTLILYYPEDDTIFYLENHTGFRRLGEIAACDAIVHDRRERFCIFTYE